MLNIKLLTHYSQVEQRKQGARVEMANRKMGSKLASFLMISLCYAGSLFAQRQESVEVYRVQPGDSLWQIAEEKLHSPWLWHELVAENPELHEPYLIYPGDEIILRKQGGKQKLSIKKDACGTSKDPHPTLFYDFHTGKVSPRKRVSKNIDPLPIIPLSKIKPFLHHAKILSTNKPLQPWPSIQALKGEHLVIGKGDSAYAAPISYPVGTLLFIFRLGKDLLHPKSQRYLGTEAQVIGEAELIQVSPNQVGTLKIVSSYREISPGDFLMLGQHEKIYPYFTPKKPSDNYLAQGEIIEVIDGVSQISQYQIVTITGGKDRQRRPGDVLTILHQPYAASVSLPKEKAGQLLVFSVYDQLSYALVVKATQPIYLLDTVASP